MCLEEVNKRISEYERKHGKPPNYLALPREVWLKFKSELKLPETVKSHAHGVTEIFAQGNQSKAVCPKCDRWACNCRKP